jgi:phosphoenolpyruvate-protein kinase (PTS system EI component)
MALVLVALGIDSLSLIPSAIPEIKEAIRRHELLPLRARLPELFALSEAPEIERRLHEWLEAAKPPRES